MCRKVLVVWTGINCPQTRGDKLSSDRAGESILFTACRRHQRKGEPLLQPDRQKWDFRQEEVGRSHHHTPHPTPFLQNCWEDNRQAEQQRGTDSWAEQHRAPKQRGGRSKQTRFPLSMSMLLASEGRQRAGAAAPPPLLPLPQGGRGQMAGQNAGAKL